ncbi:hypothetical protein CFN78_18105 [Amycolatopsis antarctica]|uniref:FHA domain-containing protein n=1 Tax=Amycolatopsis antarctica TaxID=1854586 RepID=A0A263D310_9PSEU|nr:FHA domain-containing protein [Amycolatopsis antarctica]OZM71745.1 hypothetical protein CFN78_18105 [Amycolatopsis antarctica]
MPEALPPTPEGVRLLAAETGSLARGVPPVRAGTLFVLSRHGGISVPATAPMEVVFGRREPDVHVCVGHDDRHVSRRHGVIRHDGAHWTVRNEGQAPIRFPGSQLLLGGQEELLPAAYTPLFIVTPEREHLLEVRVAGTPATPARPQHDASTTSPVTWVLSEPERLVLVALGQRYLRHEAHPQPASWSAVTEELGALRPGEHWTDKRVSHLVAEVRRRLREQGVAGLTRDEVGEPVGNALNHNLLAELLISTTLVPTDLAVLDGSAAENPRSTPE